MEPENLQSVLQEAGVQVDMKNLQNPSENFMIYLIIEYLKKFNFDGNDIPKITTEQFQCLSCPDSTSNAIKVINLYSALSSVCNEIFLTDLCLTDITNPGPKRARRQIKILFNFFAYVRNKMAENDIAFAELDSQQKEIEEKIDKKNDIIAKIGATINDQENKIELKQQLQKEIDKINLDINQNNKKSSALEHRVKDIMIQHQDIYKESSDLKAKAIKLHKVTTELQSKIVKSPEEYAARSKELERILEIKKEERHTLHNSITGKKLQIKNNENAQELVKDLNDKFTINISDKLKQSKETSEKLEYVQKELNSLKSDIAKWKNLEINNSTNVSEEDDLKVQEKRLFELNNQQTDKIREIQSQENHLQMLNNDINKSKVKLEHESKLISEIQEKNSQLLKEYEKQYRTDILEEISLRKSISDTIFANKNEI